MRAGTERGFSLVEMLVSLAVLGLVLASVADLIVNRRVERAEQMRAATQANARNCLSMIVQELRGAGWDPTLAGIAPVALDPDPADAVSQIEIFKDLNADGLTDGDGEQVLIRHVGDRLEWRRSAAGAFETLAVGMSDDADGDGVSEPLFAPDTPVKPHRIRVQLTAQSPRPDPVTGKIQRYTLSSDVLLRKES